MRRVNGLIGEMSWTYCTRRNCTVRAWNAGARWNLDAKILIYPILQTKDIKCADAGNAAGWSAAMLHENVSGERYSSLLHTPGRPSSIQVALQVHVNSSQCWSYGKPFDFLWQDERLSRSETKYPVDGGKNPSVFQPNLYFPLLFFFSEKA